MYLNLVSNAGSHYRAQQTKSCSNFYGKLEIKEILATYSESRHIVVEDADFRCFEGPGMNE